MNKKGPPVIQSGIFYLFFLNLSKYDREIHRSIDQFGVALCHGRGAVAVKCCCRGAVVVTKLKISAVAVRSQCSHSHKMKKTLWTWWGHGQRAAVVATV